MKKKLMFRQRATIPYNTSNCQQQQATDQWMNNIDSNNTNSPAQSSSMTRRCLRRGEGRMSNSKVPLPKLIVESLFIVTTESSSPPIPDGSISNVIIHNGANPIDDIMDTPNSAIHPYLPPVRGTRLNHQTKPLPKHYRLGVWSAPLDNFCSMNRGWKLISKFRFGLFYSRIFTAESRGSKSDENRT